MGSGALMHKHNETQLIAPESQGKDMSNKAALVLTQLSLFQPDVTSYAKDLLECDSTTTIKNALANTNFPIIESTPSRNLVSYSFSSEDDQNREEECIVTTVQVSENIGSQYHSEVIPHKHHWTQTIMLSVQKKLVTRKKK